MSETTERLLVAWILDRVKLRDHACLARCCRHSDTEGCVSQVLFEFEAELDYALLDEPDVKQQVGLTKCKSR